MMHNLNGDNGVNGSGANEGEGPSSDRGVRGQQRTPGCHNATTSELGPRIKWTKELNKLIMKCYLMSDPSKRGFRKRMLKIWNDIGVSDLNEQKLAGQ